MAGLKYWIWLAELSGLRSQTRLALLEHFGDPENIYYADPGEVLLVENMTREQAETLTNRSLAQVNSRASSLGLNIIADGISSTQARAQSASQSIPAGTQVLKGTVITVEFIYQDATA